VPKISAGEGNKGERVLGERKLTLEDFRKRRKK